MHRHYDFSIVRQGIIIQLIVYGLYLLFDYIPISNMGVSFPLMLNFMVKGMLLLYLFYYQLTIFALADLKSSMKELGERKWVKVLRIGLGILGLTATSYLTLWMIQMKNSVLMLYAILYGT
jgi:hypothetical protein